MYLSQLSPPSRKPELAYDLVSLVSKFQLQQTDKNQKKPYQMYLLLP